MDMCKSIIVLEKVCRMFKCVVTNTNNTNTYLRVYMKYIHSFFCDFKTRPPCYSDMIVRPLVAPKCVTVKQTEGALWEVVCSLSCLALCVPAVVPSLTHLSVLLLPTSSVSLDKPAHFARRRCYYILYRTSTERSRRCDMRPRPQYVPIYTSSSKKLLRLPSVRASPAL